MAAIGDIKIQKSEEFLYSHEKTVSKFKDMLT